MVTTEHDPLYVVGRSDHETARLQRQAQLYGPLTRRVFIEAGVSSGMRVLDVGSGAGDVALLVAELVGPTGQVVGVDTNVQILDVAGSRVRAAGWANIRFSAGDVRTAGLDGSFDAVVGRFVLGFVGNRVELLQRCIGHLRPGGLVVFQEHDVATFYRSVPASPLVEQWSRWVFQVLEALDIDRNFAMRLYRDFCSAGLRAPQVRYEVPIGGGPDWIGYEFLSDHARSLRDLLVQHRIATDEEMQIDTLAARLRAEVVNNNGVFCTEPAVGIWGRT
jgi:ubiquinone/menaquinone biosynthesis C-methylase UbiE